MVNPIVRIVQGDGQMDQKRLGGENPIRVSLYSRIDKLWKWSGYDHHSRWYTCKELILESLGIDVKTKAGKKTLRAFHLGSEQCAAAVRAMSDEDLLDLYELTARQFSKMM